MHRLRYLVAGSAQKIAPRFSHLEFHNVLVGFSGIVEEAVSLDLDFQLAHCRNSKRKYSPALRYLNLCMQ